MASRVNGEEIRVVVVDDSPTARELVAALLHTAGIRVVGLASNGEDAIRLARRLRPDVITMDVLMPRMNGLEATRQIMREIPTPIVMVSGDYMIADLDVTFAAVQAGALTVVRKPGLADPETCAELVQTVRLMAEVPVVHHWGRKEDNPAERALTLPAPSVPVTRLLVRDPRNSPRVEMIGVASSTGGPATLVTLLKLLPANFGIPVLIVQHVTRGFAAGLAEWLNGQVALRVRVASHGDRPSPGTVLIAPNDYHMQLSPTGVVELTHEEPYKGLRPSANYLFRSMARCYGPHGVGVILTGMGDDGVDGLEDLYLAGSLTLAQDEASCVVYGMPQAAVKREIVDQVLTPEEMVAVLCQLDEQARSRKS